MDAMFPENMLFSICPTPLIKFPLKGGKGGQKQGRQECQLGSTGEHLEGILDKAPRLTIKRVIWILTSDTEFINSTNICIYKY